jgi:hypothetical protein
METSETCPAGYSRLHQHFILVYQPDSFWIKMSTYFICVTIIIHRFTWVGLELGRVLTVSPPTIIILRHPTFLTGRGLDYRHDHEPK